MANINFNELASLLLNRLESEDSREFYCIESGVSLYICENQDGDLIINGQFTDSNELPIHLERIFADAKSLKISRVEGVYFVLHLNSVEMFREWDEVITYLKESPLL